MEILNFQTVVAAVAFLITTAVLRFFIKFYTHRRLYSKLPGPPHHPIWGHLKFMGELSKKFSPRVHPHLYGLYAREKYDLPAAFYLDVWPISDPIFIVHDPNLAHQFIVQHSFPKHHVSLDNWVVPVAGEKNLITMEGTEWRRWRSVFNPGFAVAYVWTLASAIVEECLVFTDILDRHAQDKTPFRLEELLAKLATDVIGRVVMDHSFDCQRTKNEFVMASRDQYNTIPMNVVLNPFANFNPLRSWRQKKNTQRMDNYIGKVLDERFSTHEGPASRPKNQRFIIDLALDTYQKEVAGNEEKLSASSMDPTFRLYAIDMMKSFIFAGHDTTSSSVAYSYRLLERHPDARARLTAELDDVLGPDTSPAAVADKIRADPYILNKLPYLNAVIKESLRLFPPASSVRSGVPGFVVKDPKTGMEYPTEGTFTWCHVVGMHRVAALWGPTSHEFHPERFLPDSGYPAPEGAFRPFEKGPRNCIGQEVAMLEMRIILAMTVRAYAFDTRFDDKILKALSKDGTVWNNPQFGTQLGEGAISDPWGEEAFQVLVIAAKPRDGLPATVSRRRD